jgi:hypothetical protein
MTATPTVPATIALIVAGATKRLFVHEIHIGTSNASALAGTRVSVGRPTTSGTGGAAYTPQPIDAAAPPAIFTALSSSTAWSAEPTQPAAYIDEFGIDAVASYPYIPKVPITVGTGTRLAVRVEADGSATKSQFVVTLKVEE